MGSTQTRRTKVAVIGSGNIGTDLMIKILRLSDSLDITAMAGIDASSDGLARARRLKVATTHAGVEGLLALDEFADVEIVFDATSAGAHRRHEEALRPLGRTLIDLTPAALGPYVVPPVNGTDQLGAPNVNMVTCGGQATIPIVAAVSSVTPVHYGEIVASLSSRSAGPGTRANIDEFTETTSSAVEQVGGAALGKAIIVLNPAEPPLMMRDTVHCLVSDCATESVAAAVEEMVARVQSYVPGYRLKQQVQFDRVAQDDPLCSLLADSEKGKGALKLSVFLEVEGAAHYLPAFAGNLDIMTSAALRTAERMAAHRIAERSRR
ncbi:acetaldehyde dehydrogenase [Streptomyces albus]|uniref:Acetaldehyde dehydrogenase n=1 Tax=Streptomyces albus (strain ATCC 21838 / DSM 41398 / FERM P-419 / JCM 4703 / NBRC 107858) TaxID=1081613 RepID=A0A0B5EGP7_STRA4|nr:acetaldehyde dehydrogenase [Streptomyces albus]AOU74842.1 acetaldehyde dehydrogenase [Streptomyces albus]AYN30650.1 acetaldehyde dehydrogenase (acetylating) [Streptomyces albus]